MQNAIPVGTIRWLVGRLHVGTSDIAVVREFRNRMTAPKWSKALRKEVYRVALQEHDENRGLYRDVMRGM